MFRKMNLHVHLIVSNISGLTPGRCVIERPKREWSLNRNEPGTRPLSKPRCAEEEEEEEEEEAEAEEKKKKNATMKLAATNTKVNV
jgi:hypothetical protein